MDQQEDPTALGSSLGPASNLSLDKLHFLTACQSPNPKAKWA